MDDPRHWPIRIDVPSQREKLLKLFEDGMYVQLKAGCVPYIRDPKVSCTSNRIKCYKQRYIIQVSRRPDVSSDRIQRIEL